MFNGRQQIRIQIIDVLRQRTNFILCMNRRGIAPRPAIAAANTKAEQQAVEAGERVFNAYLDSKNL